MEREAGGGLAWPRQGGAGRGMQGGGATRNTPKAPHLEEVGHHIDVGPRGRHKHAEREAGVDPLQVFLGGSRAAGKEGVVRPGTAPHEPPDSSPASPRCYSHVGELEEGVKVDVSVKDVHGAGLGVSPPAASQRLKLQEERGSRGGRWSPPEPPKLLSHGAGAQQEPRTCLSHAERATGAASCLVSAALCAGRACGALLAQLVQVLRAVARPGAAPGEAPTPRERCWQLESVFVPGYY